MSLRQKLIGKLIVRRYVLPVLLVTGVAIAVGVIRADTLSYAFVYGTGQAAGSSNPTDAASACTLAMQDAKSKAMSASAGHKDYCEDVLNGTYTYGVPGDPSKVWYSWSGSWNDAVYQDDAQVPVTACGPDTGNLECEWHDAWWPSSDYWECTTGASDNARCYYEPSPTPTP